MKYIFLDTNIFLHFKDLDQIDWLSEIDYDNCTLVILPIVIDELDKKKIGTNKISNRARKILNKIESFYENGETTLKKNVSILILLEKPQKEIYINNDLNFDEQDHRLIASILQFRNKNPNTTLLLCSHDIGPRLRAKQFNIGILKLGDKYILPDEISENEKKIKSLESEIKTLKYKLPKLHLSFKGKEFLKFTYKIPSHASAEENEEIMKGVRVKIPSLSAFQAKHPFSDMFTLSDKQIKDYDSELKNYLLKYEETLEKIKAYKIKMSLTFDLPFVLVNDGNLPAENIDIHLRFRNIFKLQETSTLDQIPQFPKLPEPPKTRFEDMLSPTEILSPNKLRPHTNINILEHNPIKITKNTDFIYVDYNIEFLKHGYDHKLKSISILFNSISDLKNFSVDYAISADNLPEKIDGILNVIFE